MKQCHICNCTHATPYCHVCGAFTYTINGEHKAVNRYGVELVSALGKMAVTMRYARKIQHNIPVSIGNVKHLAKGN